MEKETIISVKNIGKKYKITHQQGGYVALRDILANVLKSPFKFLKQKTKEVAGIAKKEEFWALRDINFEVKKGEVIGIIGHNGAGKSTLLKILSQITPPTEGEITINGRVGSLLEVGTGFHGELSGRENIFMNGAILGMKKKEIVRKFNDIVTFAGIEKFLDTPVKYYSSGMYVRLAFSVAAHLDPDILIIDEVLAVGDAEFQKKCLGKMDDITKKEGRTILFVSHNLDAVEQLCSRSVLIEKGSVKAVGPTRNIIDEYLRSDKASKPTIEIPRDTSKNIQITKLSLLSEKTETTEVSINQPFLLRIEFMVEKETEPLNFGISILNNQEILLNSYESDYIGGFKTYKPGKCVKEIKFPEYMFNVGSYQINTFIHQNIIDLTHVYDQFENMSFTITNKNNKRTNFTKNNIVGKLGYIPEYKDIKHA